VGVLLKENLHEAEVQTAEQIEQNFHPTVERQLIHLHLGLLRTKQQVFFRETDSFLPAAQIHFPSALPRLSLPSLPRFNHCFYYSH
jgi:hypothetical protein